MPLENQGGPATASPSPTATTQQTVTIPLEQLQTFTSIQARLAEMEAAQRTQQEAAQQEQARILAQKGEVENALRMLREQSEQHVRPSGSGSPRSRTGPSDTHSTARSPGPCRPTISSRAAPSNCAALAEPVPRRDPG